MKILFQGDSITDADRNRDDIHDLGNGYPKYAAKYLTDYFPGIDFEFVDLGISGNQTIDLVNRLESDFVDVQPDIVSILIGVNDVWHELNYKNGVDAEKFFKIYSMLIEEIKAELPDLKIMIMEPYVAKGTATAENWDYFKTEVAKRAEKSKEIAEKYNLTFIPLQNNAGRCSPDRLRSRTYQKRMDKSI